MASAHRFDIVISCYREAGGGQSESGSCTSLNDTKTTLTYSVVLRATRRRQFPSDMMTITHIHERLLNNLPAVSATGCFYFSMVPHVTQSLLEDPAGAGFLLLEVYDLPYTSYCAAPLGLPTLPYLDLSKPKFHIGNMSCDGSTNYLYINCYSPSIFE